MNVVDRFIKYIKVDSQSDPTSEMTPSTEKQLDMAKILVEDMKLLDIEDAHVDVYGIVYGTIKSNTKKQVETIGFISHMDTAPDMSGKDVKPRIIQNYDGSDIILNEELDIIMSPKTFDNLNLHIGKDLIVTDGTTLLGADDKAGVAEILDMCQYFKEHPDVEHGTIKIAFTPDEEVGRGADNFDVDKFDAAYAYTVDGGDINSIDYENFNAAYAKIAIQGSSVHPGDAKGKMVNASKLAMEFDTLLPVALDPAKTSGYEGFNHLIFIKGMCEEAEMEYIIRNHDMELFANQKQDFLKAQEIMNEKYGNVISMEIEDNYYNMAELVKEKIEIVDDVKKIMKEMGMDPISTPIRGGTDGSRLSFEGLLCPNIGTGGYNFHGKYEYICIQSMETISKLLVNIVLDKVK